jgi:Flp pilus assembly secretin CpaC
VLFKQTVCSLRYCGILLRSTAALSVALILVATFGTECARGDGRIHANGRTISTKDDDEVAQSKTSLGIDLKASRSRLFRIKNSIVRIHISDPAIVEPVVLSEHEIVLLGKKLGSTKLVIWDVLGQAVGIALRVDKKDNLPNHAPKRLMAIGHIELKEVPAQGVERLSMSQSSSINLNNRIVRFSLSDPRVADVAVLSGNELGLQGKAPGNVTLFIWGDAGEIDGIELRVGRGSSKHMSGSPKSRDKTASSSTVLTQPPVECWFGSKKRMSKVPKSVGRDEKLDQFLRGKTDSYDGYDAVKRR